MSVQAIPSTVNMHIVGHCNYSCRGCYARFEAAKTCLPLGDVVAILDQLRDRGVTRVTFAGGEPTLHPDLLPILQHASRIGLVTSLVTNASRIDARWCVHHLPWLRWLVLSCDSVNRDTSTELGRALKVDGEGQPDRVRRVSQLVHRWNRARGAEEHVRLKINMVVTRLTQDEDPSQWLTDCNPERVKLLQCLIVPGENDDASDLACTADAFAKYAARVHAAHDASRVIVAERETDLQLSYAMIDPHGCFRQCHPSGYVTSQRILDVGLQTAWEQVGTIDHQLFVDRGGVYEHGSAATGRRPPIIAVEGLDGSGKSTMVTMLAESLAATVVRCPPDTMRAERVLADRLPPRERRAFYRRGNTEAMRLAAELVMDGVPVVMDRSFASTQAYGAAELLAIATSADGPKATERPDIVFFLDVPEPERRRRLDGRDEHVTNEEQRLAKDDAFRNRVVAGYRNAGCVFIDASGPATATRDVILRTVAGTDDNGHG